MTASRIRDDVAHETKRLAALRSTGILGSGPDKRYDRITRVAAQTFQTATAVISFIDEETQWFKSTYGLELCESPRDISFCDHAIRQSRPLIVEDATKDARFLNNPFVTAKEGLRFYAGAPITVAKNCRIGTLAIFDAKPRSFSSAEADLLCDLASMVHDALRDRQRQQRIVDHYERLKEADAKIEQQRWQLQLAIEGSDLGHWDWDPVKGTVQFSDRYLGMLGYEPGELPEDYRTWKGLVHPEDMPGARRALEAYFAGNSRSFDPEFRMRHKDGSWRWIQSRGKVSHQDEHGRPLRVVGTHLDITARKLNELAILENVRQLSLAETVAGIGHWRVDLIENCLYWSEGIYQIHGVDPMEPTPDLEKAIDFYHPEDRPRVDEAVNRAISSNEPFEFECRLIQPSGEERTVVSRGEPLTDDSGNVVSIFGIFLDVTDRKKHERMKDEFISTVNHELRTPLTSIYGALDLLHNRASDQLDKQGKRLLKLAHESCNRLTHLVNDILDQEKIASGKMDFKFETADLVELVEDIVERNRALALTFGIHFETDVPDNAIHAQVDPSRFDQALVNLISNAAKFSPKDETVTISVTALGTQRVCISVADRGPGIPSEFQPKVFEPFTQADGSATRKVAGTGLGLSITRCIIEAFGGRVTFETEEGRGTTFHFILPTKETEKGREPCAANR